MLNTFKDAASSIITLQHTTALAPSLAKLVQLPRSRADPHRPRFVQAAQDSCTTIDIAQGATP